MQGMLDETDPLTVCHIQVQSGSGNFCGHDCFELLVERISFVCSRESVCNPVCRSKATGAIVLICSSVLV